MKWKGEGPSPRYSHSAAVGAAGMWVYGGLEGLQARNDLWRWSFGEKSWFYFTKLEKVIISCQTLHFKRVLSRLYHEMCVWLTSAAHRL